MRVVVFYHRSPGERAVRSDIASSIRREVGSSSTHDQPSHIEILHEGSVEAHDLGLFIVRHPDQDLREDLSRSRERRLAVRVIRAPNHVVDADDALRNHYDSQFANGIVSSVSLVSTTNTARSLAGFVLLALALTPWRSPGSSEKLCPALYVVSGPSLT